MVLAFGVSPSWVWTSVPHQVILCFRDPVRYASGAVVGPHGRPHLGGVHLQPPQPRQRRGAESGGCGRGSRPFRHEVLEPWVGLRHDFKDRKVLFRPRIHWHHAQEGELHAALSRRGQGDWFRPRSPASLRLAARLAPLVDAVSFWFIVPPCGSCCSFWVPLPTKGPAPTIRPLHASSYVVIIFYIRKTNISLYIYMHICILICVCDHIMRNKL